MKKIAIILCFSSMAGIISCQQDTIQQHNSADKEAFYMRVIADPLYLRQRELSKQVANGILLNSFDLEAIYKYQNEHFIFRSSCDLPENSNIRGMKEYRAIYCEHEQISKQLKVKYYPSITLTMDDIKEMSRLENIKYGPMWKEEDSKRALEAYKKNKK